MYNEKFKKEAKDLYPDYKELHNLLDNNSPLVGRYLQGTWKYGVPNDEILTALTLEEVQAKARIEKRKANLYETWLKDYSIN